MRFHLDEHVDHAIATGLGQRGIDVTTAVSAGLLSAPDEAHIAFALREQRVIFTNDSDFLRLAASGVSHAGIVYCAPQARTIGDIVRHLCLMHDCLAADDMKNMVEFA